MAHNINRHALTGQDAFFSVKEKAWHNLGQIVQDYPTAEEAIIFAGLNYEVEKRPLFTDGQEVPKYSATVRTDTAQILGVVGSKYEVVQNRTAFSFFDALVQNKNGIKYETAGALGDGERIFITAKMPDTIKVCRKDEIEKYIFLTTTHDGSGSIMAAFTPVRIVCNNTLTAALSNHSNAVYIKHTANAEQKLQEAARIISITESTSEILQTMFNKWAKITLNDAEIKKLIALAIAPNKEIFSKLAAGEEVQHSSSFRNKFAEILEYNRHSPTQQMASTENTIFGVYNAITGYYQNSKSFASVDKKLNSILYGSAADYSKQAFEVCENAADYLN